MKVKAEDAERLRRVGLCASCQFRKIVRSQRASEFWLCERSRREPQFPRYPTLPVLRCAGYARLADKPPDQ
ncbi:MAG TPA: hypothetical protein VGI10_07925 [Polyangiaceae bacterium]|jgi:hypothetical protein